jgi:hypothetical protein
MDVPIGRQSALSCEWAQRVSGVPLLLTGPSVSSPLPSSAIQESFPYRALPCFLVGGVGGDTQSPCSRWLH